MPIRPLFFIAAVIAAPVASQVAPREAAKAFTLDSVAPAPTPEAPPAADSSPVPAPTLPAPTLPESVAVSAPSTPPSDPAPATRGVFTLDTPIQDLIADTGAKAVLDKDLPGMSDDENLAKFKALSLRSLQPQTGGQLTDAMLAKVASDLDVLAGGTGAVVAPVKAGNAKRGKDESR